MDDTTTEAAASGGENDGRETVGGGGDCVGTSRSGDKEGDHIASDVAATVLGASERAPLGRRFSGGGHRSRDDGRRGERVGVDARPCEF